MGLEYKFQQLEGFPREFTKSRTAAQFGKTWTQVLEILERELRLLGYRRGSVVLMTGHSAWDLRKDGTLRADVRNPEHPGVVLRFDKYNRKLSRYEPMQFECDQFTYWKDNVRAIADAMEALRKVNRYGVSSQGVEEAHYQGYKALPSAEGRISDVDTAFMFLAEHSTYQFESLHIKEVAKKAYSQALHKLHPDKGGDNELFLKLQDAKRILGL